MGDQPPHLPGCRHHPENLCLGLPGAGTRALPVPGPSPACRVAAGMGWEAAKTPGHWEGPPLCTQHAPPGVAAPASPGCEWSACKRGGHCHPGPSRTLGQGAMSSRPLTPGLPAPQGVGGNELQAPHPGPPRTPGLPAPRGMGGNELQAPHPGPPRTPGRGGQ